MTLVERLEKLAKELDRDRWQASSSAWGRPRYDTETVERSDLIAAAAQHIRELEQKCPT